MKNQLERPRLSISIGDFKQARTFASFIIQKRLHTKSQTEYVRLLHLAFDTSLIVAYSRPFSWNNDLANGKSSLRHLITTVLTPDEVILHDKILGLRNTAYGHSDASSHLFSSNPDFKLMKDAFTSLTLDETRRLSTILRKWIGCLEQERNQLKRPVPTHIQQIVGRERRERVSQLA